MLENTPAAAGVASGGRDLPGPAAQVAGRTQDEGFPWQTASTDIVSKVDRQEVDNALNQAGRGGDPVRLQEHRHHDRLDGRIDGGDRLGHRGAGERGPGGLRDKLVKRGVSLKALTADEPRSSGTQYKIACTFTSGITTEQAKKLAKIIRDEGPKGVKTQVMGDELRVSAKSRDALQTVIALVKGTDLDFATQFVNYR